jgi:hypothetical protein
MPRIFIGVVPFSLQRNLTINLAPVTDSIDGHRLAFVINRVQRPAITDTQPIALLPLQFRDARWARIVFESQQPRGNPLAHTRRERVEFFFRRAFEQHLVGHGGLPALASILQVFAERASRLGAALFDDGQVHQIAAQPAVS